MRRDPGFIRFMAAMEFGIFTATGVVVASNYFEIFVFWALLSLGMYLLINHWWRLREVAVAARRAVLVVGVSDSLFLAGILYLFFRFHELNFAALTVLPPSGRIKAAGLAILCLLIFAGAAGKSALVPLWTWIAQAREAPTPGFALILGAAMPLGIYLAARTYDLFHYSGGALAVVAIVGAVSALLGGLWAIFQDNLRRVIAFVAMSQLGVAALGLGIQAYAASVYQVVLWGLDATLLALTAGTVVAAMRTESLREMGGLWRRLPATRVLMLAAVSSGAVLPPFGLFWTSAAIVARALQTGNAAAAAALLLAVGFIALALWRMYLLVFGGQTAHRRRFDPERISEPGGRMALPLWLLAIPVAVGGVRLVDLPILGQSLLTFVRFPGLKNAPLTIAALLLTVVASVIGSALGAWWGLRRVRVPATRPWSALDRAIEREFWIPLGYGWATGQLRHWVGLGATLTDRRGIDAALQTAEPATLWLSRAARPLRISGGWRGAAGVIVGMALLAIVAVLVSGHGGGAFG
jgi:NADH-quinone oxidoreductase subunit L